MTVADGRSAARRPGRARAREHAPLLEVEGLRKAFGGLVAVDGAGFTVEAGGITGLIGPNGAGKSTLFSLIAGALRPDAGRVRFRGRAVTGGPPERLARAGLARTFQTPRLFHGMSCWENLMVGAPAGRDEGVWTALWRPRNTRERQAALGQRALEMLDFLGLAHLADARADALSGGQRKLLAFGRALMAEPSLLMLDEPAAGVNETLTRTLVDRIRTVNARGVTFLLVEHDMDLVMDLCDRVVVMHQGRVLADGDPQSVQRDPAVRKAYLGGPA